jgi:hypothetical protein
LAKNSTKRMSPTSIASKALPFQSRRLRAQAVPRARALSPVAAAVVPVDLAVAVVLAAVVVRVKRTRKLR